ncbi:hypothetical protein RWE15_11335 [Virgibacillus halophilus]|uniref:Uncharacterized protein n=1 Tax=Tigheibacillus halophilus TaxID=361280 RepID=A0ABU5C779_9BACI|nr:hypothetical protein [Virgibacillus halophilus]
MFDSKLAEYTYVFKIKGLKISTFPIQIGEILFYNPIREDLLIHLEKQRLFEYEMNLMSKEDRELHQEWQSVKGARGYEYIEYTDCHARICIKASSEKEGAILAKKENRYYCSSYKT